MHGASDVGGPGNGDMGQAFDFDLDGDLDLLSGSEGGKWYLHANERPGNGNYALVKVGYAPTSQVDPIAAEVIVETATGTYRKRVGSAGEIFSQSLRNIVHFGLGDADRLQRVTVRWRDGETVFFENKSANTLLDTDKLDPESITLSPAVVEVRANTSYPLEAVLSPHNANEELVWSSSDDTVATVDNEGNVIVSDRVGSGAIITALSSANGLAASS